MASISEYRQEQISKLNELKELGVNPYPAVSYRDTSSNSIISDFDKFENKEVTVAGRVMSIRTHGKLKFIDIADESGKLQVLVRSENVTANYASSEISSEDIRLLARGDIIESRGLVIKSQTNEISVEASTVRILAKVIRPLPEELTDKEARLRRRYLDMAINPEIKDRFKRRSKFWQATREFLDKKDFTEVNIPVLEHTTGGADANPFVTHMDALGEDFYLRISHELPLKRLIGGGYEKVYDIGPRFRNENYSDEHLPEHVAMEWYWAYADWQNGMEMMESMFKYVLEKTFGTLQFELNGKKVDMSGEWQRWKYQDVIKENYGLDVFDCTLEQVKEQLQKHGLEVEKSDNKSRGIDKLWKKLRADVAGPVWLIDTPKFISPLSKADDQDPRYVQRFQAVIGGSELCNGWSELNDPIDQFERFLEQQNMRNSGDDEAQMLDIDYVEMLEYGMPPTCGLGFSERVFWVFEGVSAREGVPFPQLRSETSEATKSIYPEVYGPDGLIAKSGQKSQDFSKRIVAVVDKSLENWQVANAASHMSAYHANKMSKSEFESGSYFVTKDGFQLPRNSQYPILIKRADQKDLHKLLAKAKKAGLKYHVFIKEMIDTTNDQEIVESLKSQNVEDLNIYGVALFGENDEVNAITKHFQLWN